MSTSGKFSVALFGICCQRRSVVARPSSVRLCLCLRISSIWISRCSSWTLPSLSWLLGLLRNSSRPHRRTGTCRIPTSTGPLVGRQFRQLAQLAQLTETEAMVLLGWLEEAYSEEAAARFLAPLPKTCSSRYRLQRRGPVLTLAHSCQLLAH